MMNYARFMVGIFTLLPLTTLSIDLLQGKSVFIPRDSSSTSSMEAILLFQQQRTPALQNKVAHSALISRYSHSFHPRSLAQALWGVDIISISGSALPNRGEQDLLADQFGLSRTYQGSVSFDPFISSASVTFFQYAHLDCITPGLYAYGIIPFQWTYYGLRMKESIIDDGVSSPFPAHYMSSTEVAPLASFTQAMSGCATFGDMQSPLAYGRIGSSRTAHHLADIHLVAGYTLIDRAHGSCSIQLRGAIPTSPMMSPTHLFAPVIGQNNHAQLGVGILGNVLLWEKDHHQELTLTIAQQLTHIFGAHACRSFDLNNRRFGSRYLLLKTFDENGGYAGSLVPAINVTTLPVKTSFDIQWDFSVIFEYRYDTFNFGVGYNGWLRSHERLSLRDCIQENRYGIKGIQNVVTDADAPSNTTQKAATIFGSSFSSSFDQLAVADADSPVFLTTADLDLRSGAASRMSTHKLCMHLGYTFSHERYALWPHLSAGGDIEFEGANEHTRAQNVKNALSQWSIWCSTGFTF